MSVVFLRVPGFESGWPRGLFQAIFGISSLTLCASVDADKHETESSNSSRHFFIEPPKTHSLLKMNSNRCSRFPEVPEVSLSGARMGGEKTQHAFIVRHSSPGSGL